jgi:hypothetical protein
VDDSAPDLIELTPLRLTPKKASRELSVEVLREITEADRGMLVALEGSTGTSRPTVVQRLRDSHHRAAKAFAAGMTPGQVGQQTGYSQSRLSVLLQDKSFQDLVEVYRKSGCQEFLEYSDLSVANMILGERLLNDSLHEIGERDHPLTLTEIRPILELVSARQDRFGFPKQAVNHNVNHDFAGRLQAARQRSGLTSASARPLKLIPGGEPES